MLQPIGHRADLLGTGVTGIGTPAEASCVLYSRLATWKGKVALCLPTLWFECLLQVPLVSFLSWPASSAVAWSQPCLCLLRAGRVMGQASQSRKGSA